jgi:hypothetical protein
MTRPLDLADELAQLVNPQPQQGMTIGCRSSLATPLLPSPLSHTDFSSLDVTSKTIFLLLITLSLQT